MAKSRVSRKVRQRDRKLNCQTRRVVESVLESVLDEKCKIRKKPWRGSSEPSVINPVIFSATPNAWTLTEVDKEFMGLKVPDKKIPTQMEPFFSIGGSFPSSATISKEEQAKFYEKWSYLLKDAGIDTNLLKLIKTEEDSKSEDETRKQPEPETESRRMSLPLQTLSPTDHYASESRRKGIKPKPTKQRGRVWRKSIHQIPLIPVTTPDLMRDVLHQPIDQRQFLYPTQMIAPPGFETPVYGLPIGLVNGYAPFYPFPKSVFPTPLDALKYENCQNENDL